MLPINNAALIAREAARNRATGEFGAQQHTAPDMSFDELDDEAWLDGAPEPTPADWMQEATSRAIAVLDDPASTPKEREQAVRVAGRAVADRAEQVAGITAEVARREDQERIDYARRQFEYGEVGAQAEAAEHGYERIAAQLREARKRGDSAEVGKLLDKARVASDYMYRPRPIRRLPRRSRRSPGHVRGAKQLLRGHLEAGSRSVR